MTHQELLTVVKEGLENGRIAPHLAAYIAAEVLSIEACATGCDERVRLEDEADERYSG